MKGIEVDPEERGDGDRAGRRDVRRQEQGEAVLEGGRKGGW